MLRKLWGFLSANWLILLGLVIHLIMYISAWKTGWLNYFFSGSSLHLCCRGLDFYQVPNGAYSYLHGGSLQGEFYSSDPIYSQGFFSNNNVYHPIFTLIIGGLLTIPSPEASFYVWMASKLIITIAIVIYFYHQFRNSRFLQIALFLMLINSTQYIEIEISQFQFVLNVFLLLLLVNVYKGRSEFWSGFFYFCTLISKPVSILWIPLLFMKGHWRLLFVGLGLFLISTAVFYWMGVGGYFIDNMVIHFLNPYKGTGIQIFTLDALLRSFFVPQAVLSFLKLLGATLLILPGCFKRISFGLSAYLAVIYYLFFYDFVFEYHYTTLAVILAFCLVTCHEFQSRWAIILCIWVSLPDVFGLLHLTTIGFVQDSFLGPDPTVFGWQLMVLSRIVPLTILTGVVMKPHLKGIWADLNDLWDSARKLGLLG